MTTVLAIDQGTSGTKAIVVDEAGTGRCRPPRSRVRPRYLDGGGVEQDPEALLDSVVAAGRPRARRRPGCRSQPSRWPTRARPCWPGTATPGGPLTPVIVWQDRRAEAVVPRATPAPPRPGARPHRPVLDPYFSAPKMALAARHPHHRRAWSPPPTPGWSTGCAARSSPTPRPPAGRCCSTSTRSPGSTELLGLFGLDGRAAAARSSASDEVVGEHGRLRRRRFRSPG